MLTMRPMLVLVAMMGLLSAPSGALADSSDEAVTQSYIRSNYALVQAARGHVPNAEKGIAAVLAQIRSECPKGAAGSPQNHDSEQLSDEVVGAIVVAGVHPSVTSIKAFIRSVRPLRWSSRTLTSTIQTYTDKLERLLSVAAPNLCGDVRAWVASGYQTLPARTVRFDAQYTPVWVALGDLPGSLSPFEGPAERGLIARSNQLEDQLTEYEARAVESYGEILDALDLKQ